MMKKILSVLMLSSVALMGCKEEPKTANVEQPNIEKQSTEISNLEKQKVEQPVVEQEKPKTEPEIQQKEEQQAVKSDQEIAKNIAENPQSENKAKDYDKQVEEAQKATIDAANKLAGVMESKMEQVTEKLAETMNQIDIAKTTEKLADKINEIDVDKMAEPLKEQMNKLNNFLDNLDMNKQPEKPKTKADEGYL